MTVSFLVLLILILAKSCFSLGGSQTVLIDFPWSFFQSHNCLILASVKEHPDPDLDDQVESQVKSETGKTIYIELT